ncbi:MAG TPA: glycosyltransferase family 4 protein [Solirubrobacteraceae bacterium]|jgi:glycosyltransferase involved in cell wall biosynthesis|nr:glycosyltransferase family 4 protein [Solirubrobacteraceae bacterium]
MRVALLNPCFWPEVRRGSERFADELARALMARGHVQPRLIVSHPGPPTRRVEDGLTIVRVPRPPDRRLRRRCFEDHLTHVPFSYAALLAGEDDLAHALFPTDALAAVRWARRRRRPAILSYMGIPHRQALAARRGRVEVLTRALDGVDAVVALSRAAADGFERWLGAQACVIAPPVDLQTFSPGGERAEDPTILCAADLREPRKRVPLLLEAFALVRRERPRARLVLSRPRADAPLVPAGVELVDLDDRHALAQANRAAWVAALPSVGEAFGLTVAEALACGTPAVVSDLHALPELIDDPSLGRRFAGDDPAALARALLEALELAGDPGTAAACRRRAEPFSRAACADAYEALYRGLL